jgi:ring-1,2-phenylacetyl-CoA epoxidase subunit PaaD
VWAALDALTDPEIPVVTLREMGILRDVRLATDGHTVEVVITPTYNGCPAMEQIEDDVRASVTALGLQAHVISQLAPAWTTDWMSEVARQKLRDYGIAPPAACGQPTQVVQFARHRAALDVVPCPRCGSHDTTETSHFGSTACKALYKCLHCMEPFDYFKPY